MAAPTFSTVVPAVGEEVGTTAVVITGTNFATGVVVTFDGVAATSVVRVSATQITCNAPAHVPGAVNIVITNLDAGTVTGTAAFTYTLTAGDTALIKRAIETISKDDRHVADLHIGALVTTTYPLVLGAGLRARLESPTFRLDIFKLDVAGAYRIESSRYIVDRWVLCSSRAVQ